MMKKLTFLFAIVQFCLFSAQQNINWIKTFGAAPNTSTIIKKTLIDSDDNIYTLGSFSFYSNFQDNTTTNAITINGTNSYVAKYNNSGVLLWVSHFSGAAHDFAFDSNENIILTGGFNGQINFSDGTSLSSTLPNYAQMFAIKLAKIDGGYNWKYTLPNGSNEHRPSYGMALTVLSDNSVIIGTNFIGPISAPRLQLVKLDSNGIFLIKKPFNDPDLNGYDFQSIKSDNADNIYIGGSFYYDLNVNLNGGTYNLVDPSNNNSLTAFVAKYNSNFDIQWAKAIGGPNADQVLQMEVDKVTQKSYVSIAISGNCDLNNGSSPAVIANIWQGDNTGALAIYDSTGQLEHHHVYTGAGFNVGRGFIWGMQLKNGTLTLSGSLDSQPDVDISTASLFPPSPAVNTNLSNFITVIDVSNNNYNLKRNLFFARSINTSAAGLKGLLTMDQSKLIFAGNGKSLIPLPGNELLNPSTSQSFIVSVDSQILGTKEHESEEPLIKLATDNGGNNLHLLTKFKVQNVTMITADGRIVLQSKSKSISLIDIPHGVYFLIISTDKGTITEKFRR